MHCQTRCFELQRASTSRSGRSNSRICSQTALSSASIKEHAVDLWSPRSFTRTGYGESSQTDSETCHEVHDIYSQSSLYFPSNSQPVRPAPRFLVMSTDELRRNLPVSQGRTCAFFAERSGDWKKSCRLFRYRCTLAPRSKFLDRSERTLRFKQRAGSAACKEHANEFDGNTIP